MGTTLATSAGCSDNYSSPPDGLGPEEVPVREKSGVDVTLLPEQLTSKYEVVDNLGSGSFGAVYKVRDLKTKVVYAAKYVENRESDMSEVEIQAKMDDPHVVKILDTIILPSIKRMVIIMEYCEGGNLLQWIQRSRRHHLLNEVLVLNMFREICASVHSCHQKRIIHRDLKPENVLLDGKRRIKLADFGVARLLNRRSMAKSFCGTPPYMAPELFVILLTQTGQTEGVNLGCQLAVAMLRAASVEHHFQAYDGKCDVWSIGCILWDMANKAGLFLHQQPTNMGYNMALTSESISSKEIEDLVEKDIPDEYILTKRFLRGMLMRDVDQRLSLSDILQDSELRHRLQNPLDGHWSDIV